MNIDMAALHAIEADKGISVDIVVDTIKSALLTAYRHTEGHEADARIDVDRKTGVVKVMARETDDDGNPDQRMGRHPRGIRPYRGDHRAPGDPAAAARRREREDVRRVLGPRGRYRRRGRSSATPGPTPAAAGGGPDRQRDQGLRGRDPAAEQVPGESYEHGDRLRVLRRRRDPRGPRADDHAVAHPPQPGAQAVLPRGARDRRRIGGDRRGGARRPGTGPRSP